MSAIPATTEPSVLDRLVSAADAALLDVDIDAVTIDAVAVAAGVSRATAFRRLGTREDMIVAVGMLRAARYARTCAVEMDRYTSVLDKIEAAFRNLARELPADPVMRALFMVQTAADIGDEAGELALATLGPVIEHGRASGAIRTDVSAERVLAWIVEQLYLEIQQPDRTEDTARARVQLFLIPALRPQWPRISEANAVNEELRVLSSALSVATEATHAIYERMAAASSDDESG